MVTEVTNSIPEECFGERKAGTGHGVLGLGAEHPSPEEGTLQQRLKGKGGGRHVHRGKDHPRQKGGHMQRP